MNAANSCGVRSIPKFRVSNWKKESVKVAIEPWAQLEILHNEDEMWIEYEDPADFSFYIRDDGITVEIVSDRIKIITGNFVREFHQSYETQFKKITLFYYVAI